MKATYAILFAAIASVCAARQLQQSTTGRVTFFDNTNYSGGGQAFQANVPATGCGDCTDLVRTDICCGCTQSGFRFYRVGISPNNLTS